MMDAQIQNAIEIAGNPTSDQHLKTQAFDFINQIRSNPASTPICLSLFVRSPPLSEVVRHVSLEVVNNAVKSQQLDFQTLVQTKDELMDYIRKQYGEAGSNGDPYVIQSKLAQTLTLLFASLYTSGWETFFQDFLRLTQSNGVKRGRSAAILLYLRILASVNDEIADQLINVDAQKKQRFTELKDLIRVRDASNIASSWQSILSSWREHDTETIVTCLKVISRWVSWTDITLIANEAVIGHIFEIASQQEDAELESKVGRTRDTAIEVFAEIISKKMKSEEKIRLIRFLRLDAVVDRLVSTPAISTARGTPRYDTDMAEAVAKLVNNIVTDITKALDTVSDPGGSVRADADQLLDVFVPHLLRFFSDEYDEVCSSAMSSLNELLTYFRKYAKVHGSLTPQYHKVLAPITDALVAKMKYDDTCDWGAEDEETDEAEFQELRKRLNILQHMVAAIDENLYLEIVGNVVESTFSRSRIEGTQLDWRDLELGLQEMFLMGELALRNGGLYQKRSPSSAASERLIQMMSLMLELGKLLFSQVNSNQEALILGEDLSSHPHPAIQLEYIEICVRYCSYFEQHPQHIGKVLEGFVIIVHSSHNKVRAKSWMLFLRFVRHLRAQLSSASENIVYAISDLLPVRAELPSANNQDDESPDESEPEDLLFNSQLSLFEAVGCLSSTSSINVDVQVNLAQAINDPLIQGIKDTTPQAVRGDELSILQIHHLLEALGNVAQGFSGAATGAQTSNLAAPVVQHFEEVSEKILGTLDSLKRSSTVRAAARYTFSRMLVALGAKILPQLPRWIDGFLSESSPRDEITNVLRQLQQITHQFKSQIYNILDTLLTPLLQRVFAGFAAPVQGTDDQINLGELRKEYLNFLSVLLNNGLESTLVSANNQAMFETIISSIEHFAKDTTQYADARLAFSVLTRMASIWGGPDIPNPAANPASPSPVVPGFDRYMISRFSPLTWAMMTSTSFRPDDTQAQKVLAEIAVLQQTILAKTGREYTDWLRNVELRNMGAQDAAIDQHLHALSTMDEKNFRQFLRGYLSRDTK